MTIQSKGGHARAAKMTPEERSECASTAANARWSKDYARKDPELKTLGKIVAAFTTLDESAKRRTAKYLMERFCESFMEESK